MYAEEQDLTTPDDTFAEEVAIEEVSDDGTKKSNAFFTLWGFA
jgi:hypothetical protein